MNEREWLARRFEEMLGPVHVDQALSDRAYAHFNELLLQYSATNTVEPAMSTDADAARRLEETLRTATARAAQETAAAIRSGKL